MKYYSAYAAVILFYLAIFWIGGSFTRRGVRTWYLTISKPDFTPPGSFIGMVWTIIYILAAASFLVFVDAAQEKQIFWPIIGLYILNGIINAAWSYIFFVQHHLGLAVVNAALIGLTVVLLMLVVWPFSQNASILLLPYASWVSFATYLAYRIYRMNSVM